VYSYANSIALPEYPRSDCVVTLLKSQRGIVGKVFSSFGAELPHTHFLRVYGSRATIIDNYLYDERGVKSVLHKPLIVQQGCTPGNYAPPLRLITWAARAALGTRDRLFFEIHEAGRKLLGIVPHAFCFDTHEHTLASVRSAADFVQAIRTSQASLVNAREGAMTVAACEAGTISFLEQRPVAIEEVMGDIL